MKVYQFDTEIAAQYGVEEAIMIWNFQYWIEHNEYNGIHFHDGRYWTYNSVEAFSATFPFWSKGQIRRILKSLEDKGVIVTGDYNQRSTDRTKWYAFTDEFRNQQMHLSKSANGNVEIEKSNNIDSNTRDSNLQIVNTDSSADGGLFPSESDSESVIVTRPAVVKTKTRERKCLFEDSKFFDFELFKAQFTESDFADVDLFYYYNRIKNWSGANGQKKNDWILTARNWMMDDAEKGKLHRKTAPGGLDAGALEYLREMSDMDHQVWEGN